MPLKLLEVHGRSFWSSERAADALNYWVTSPALVCVCGSLVSCVPGTVQQFSLPRTHRQHASTTCRKNPPQPPSTCFLLYNKLHTWNIASLGQQVVSTPMTLWSTGFKVPVYKQEEHFHCLHPLLLPRDNSQYVPHHTSHRSRCGWEVLEWFN